jgi:hypothetical protein
LVRRALGHIATKRAVLVESPLANKVTSCPAQTSSSVSHETTRSVPPYPEGGTLSESGEIWAILMML